MMDKNDILAQSRRENEFRDERDLQVRLKASQNAVTMVVIVITVLYLILLIRSLLGGPAFDDWYLIFLPLAACKAGEHFTLWRSYKKPYDLIMSALALICVLFGLSLRIFCPVVS